MGARSCAVTKWATLHRLGVTGDGIKGAGERDELLFIHAASCEPSKI